VEPVTPVDVAVSVPVVVNGDLLPSLQPISQAIPAQYAII
jgi:hypothetical protein